MTERVHRPRTYGFDQTVGCARCGKPFDLDTKEGKDGKCSCGWQTRSIAKRGVAPTELSSHDGTSKQKAHAIKRRAKAIHECISCGQRFYIPTARDDNRCPHCGEPIKDDVPSQGHDQHDAKHPRQGCRYCLARGWVQS